ncbi:hypothetical protein BRARA_E01572 [Brassica rapa]|uniref:RING-type domain-containing protein n=1 Tax=Brassica campestris TaxID=3711 RepID=A0A397ZJB6_BRACM|nr:hypothetical protein BRARA_E01572 [Brassica rapa]
MIIHDTSQYVMNELLASKNNRTGDLDITISITDYNPTATERLDVDLIITNLEGTIRLPTAEEENVMCTICLENYPVNRICSLVCGHTFHFPCIDQWIHGTISCPICMESNYDLIFLTISKLLFVVFL